MAALSVREAIVQRLVARLSAAGAVPGCSGVFRNRAEPLARGEGACIVIRSDRETPQSFTDDIDRLQLDVAVEFVCRALPGQSWEPLADALFVAAHRLVYVDANADGPTLWDVVDRGGADYQQHEADYTAGALVQIYQFTYLSASVDATQYIG